MKVKLRVLDVVSRGSGYLNAWTLSLSRKADALDMRLGSAYERERSKYVVPASKR